MAKVIYNSEIVGTPFSKINEDTYFNYNGALYLLICKDNGLVFGFNSNISFYWAEMYDTNVNVLPISSDRITIQIN